MAIQSGQAAISKTSMAKLWIGSTLSAASNQADYDDRSLGEGSRYAT
jgi:hypothetical protein